MRRLYSTFAGGWPGTGLLLMRLVIGSVLIVRGGLAAVQRPSAKHNNNFRNPPGTREFS